MSTLEGVLPPADSPDPRTDRDAKAPAQRAVVLASWEYLCARVFLGTVHLATVLLALLVAFPDCLDWTCVRNATTTGFLSPARHTSALVFSAALVPPLLSRLCYLLINHRAARRPVSFELPRDVGQATCDKVRRTWRYEMARACWSLSRAEFFASIWGLVTTLVILASVAFLLPAILQGSPIGGARQLCALAVTTAAATRYLIDFAKVCMRTASDDASKRMFAEALEALLLSVVSTAAIMLLAPSIGPAGLNPTTPMPALGLGAAVAILGVPAFEHARGRIEGLIGSHPSEIPQLLPLSAIAGVSAAEIDRLKDEGICSVEALVTTPIPRLFLATRFSLQRICDWYDRGLLLCRLGPTVTAELKASAGVVGVLALSTMYKQSAKTAAGILGRAMRSENDEEALAILQSISSDESTVLLRTFGQTDIIPREEDDTAARI